MPTSSPDNWGFQATHPQYDTDRGEVGSLRHSSTKGLSPQQIAARDRMARPRMGSWLEQMAAERAMRAETKDAAE